MHVLLHSVPPILQQVPTDKCLRWRVLDTPRLVWSVSCGVTAPFSWVLVHKVLLCLPRVYFPVLCKFSRLCGGVNGDVLQEGLCHTPTQSLCTCSSPQLTYTSTGNAQTQFCVSLCECPESWYTQGLFEPSERLWQEWGLILNANSPLLPSCWGCSLALAYGVSLLKINSKIPSVQSLSRVQLFATP